MLLRIMLCRESNQLTSGFAIWKSKEVTKSYIRGEGQLLGGSNFTENSGRSGTAKLRPDTLSVLLPWHLLSDKTSWIQKSGSVLSASVT